MRTIVTGTHTREMLDRAAEILTRVAKRWACLPNRDRETVKNRKHAGLADGSVCPTLTHQDLRLSGAGAFACEPIFHSF